ncbi:MAG: hypothetical protein DCC75_08280 [Proteobacteria bacterium]|nr:MAG: hypothetical protein DCC75_08280 [Pseudomonadota bacterium]
MRASAQYFSGVESAGMKGGKIVPVSFQNLCVIIAVISVLKLGLERFAMDPGVGWHLATGRWISENAAIPKSEPFLHYTEGRKWISDQWLSDLLMFGLYKLGSWPLLYSLFVTLYFLTFLLVLYRGLSSQRNISLLAVTFGSFFAFKAGQVHLILRPVILSFVMFATLYVGVLKVKERAADQRLPGWWFLVLPLLFALWANLHPSFSLGLAVLGLLCVTESLEVLSRGGGVIRKLGPLVILLMVCLAATLLNPYGVSLHYSVLALGKSEYFMNLHSEWRGIKFASPEGRFFIVSFGIIGLAAALLGFKRTGLGLFEWLTLLIFAGLTIKAVRFLPYYGIVASYPLALCLSNVGRSRLFTSNSALKRLHRAFSFLEQRERSSASYIALGLSLLIVINLVAALGSDYWNKRWHFGPEPAKYPYAALEYLKQQGGGEQALIVASTSNWGGFITWFGEGRLKPIFDDRNTLVGENFHKRYSAAIEEGRELEELLKALKVDYLMLPSKAGLAGDLKQDPGRGGMLLTSVFEDQLAVIFRCDKIHRNN